MQIPCRGERVVPTSVEPTSEEPTREETTSEEPTRQEPTRVERTSEEPTSVGAADERAGAGERAMPKSAMTCGVAALPHQHGNVSQAMRGWEARLTAGIRARCTQWVIARHSHTLRRQTGRVTQLERGVD